MPARPSFAVAVAALAAAGALFLAGCSTTIGGSGRAASSPADASSSVASAPESPSPQPPSPVTGTTPRSEPNSPTPVVPTVSVPLTVAPSSAPGGPPTSSAEPPPSSDLSPTTTTVTVTASPGRTSGGPTTSGTTTGASSAADPFAGSSPVDPDSFPGTVTPIGFASPSGNITCGFQATRNPMVVCQIAHHSYPATGGECHGAGSWGDTVTVAVGLPATFLCAGDVESGGPTLAYGKRIDVSGLSCVSRENGVTCKDTAGGAGFRLASGSYDLF